MSGYFPIQWWEYCSGSVLIEFELRVIKFGVLWKISGSELWKDGNEMTIWIEWFQCACVSFIFDMVCIVSGFSDLCVALVLAKLIGWVKNCGALEQFVNSSCEAYGGAGINDVFCKVAFVIMHEFSRRFCVLICCFVCALGVVALDSEKWVWGYWLRG